MTEIQTLLKKKTSNLLSYLAQRHEQLSNNLLANRQQEWCNPMVTNLFQIMITAKALLPFSITSFPRIPAHFPHITIQMEYNWQLHTILLEHSKIQIHNTFHYHCRTLPYIHGKPLERYSNAS